MTKSEFIRLIEPLVERRYPKSQIRAELADGGWVVEIVHPAFGEDAHAETSEAFRALDAALAPHREFIWRLCTAANELGRFSEHATLRTNPTRMIDGVLTSTLMAEDCYLDITEFDAELLHYAYRPEWDRHVHGIESRSDGKPLLSFKRSSKYLTIETGGSAYPIENIELPADTTPQRVVVRVLR
jgi:hypothetical protein